MLFLVGETLAIFSTRWAGHRVRGRLDNRCCPKSSCHRALAPEWHAGAAGRAARRPAVAAGWVAHVGSANERPGITGIAHLFEHMMFKGTPPSARAIIKKTCDYRRTGKSARRNARRRSEDASRLSCAAKSMISEAGKFYRALQGTGEEFQRADPQQREILVKNEFDRIYTSAGASGMNAFTTADMTGYFITVPANKLEFWMWMESERLLRPGLPRILCRARCGVRGTPDAHRIDSPRQIRGNVRSDVLGLASL